MSDTELDVVQENGAEPHTRRRLSAAMREELILVDDRQTEDVDVPEWDMVVTVRGMSGSERDTWEQSMMREEPTGRGGGRTRTRMDFHDVRAKLLVRSIIDPDTGDRIFTDKDVSLLGSKSASALQRVFEVCQRLSRLTDEDVEELTKNSDDRDRADEGGSD